MSSLLEEEKEEKEEKPLPQPLPRERPVAEDRTGERDVHRNLRQQLTRERAQEVAQHWSDLTGKTTSIKAATAVADFHIPMPQLLEVLDRLHAAGSYSLGSPVIRAALQRLESEVRKVEGQRLGPVSLSDRLAAMVPAA
ncbi:MAG: hypothetical protein ACYDB4_17795 [Candidatus Dormibacteraceae bacterium]